jgi:hypothetical protein
LSQIERQFHRFDEVESKLDNLKNNIDSKIDGSQKAQTTEHQTMTGQILSVMEAQEAFRTSIDILSDKLSLLMGLIADKTMVHTNKDTLNLCQLTPNSSPSTTSGSARACTNS